MTEEEDVQKGGCLTLTPLISAHSDLSTTEKEIGNFKQ